MEINLNQIDVAKIVLSPGDALMVTIKADTNEWAILDHLGKQFQEHFPNNKIVILGCKLDQSIEYSVINEPAPKPADLGYCTDCNCGKKEQAGNLK